MGIKVNPKDVEQEAKWVTEVLVSSGAVSIPEIDLNLEHLANKEFILWLPNEVVESVVTVLVLKSMVKNFLKTGLVSIDPDVRSFVEAHWKKEE